MTTFTEPGFWDDRYVDEHYLYGQRPNAFLLENVGYFKDRDNVLSLAEGEGRNAVFLAQRGYQVAGVDFSTRGREKALQLACQQNVTLNYDVADLTQYDFGTDRWDGIVSIFCHLAAGQRSALYASIKLALKPGGVFLHESYNKRQLDFKTGGPKDADHLPSLEELTDAFGDFQIVLARNKERHINEGQGHLGLSSVVQFIARKPAE